MVLEPATFLLLSSPSNRRLRLSVIIPVVEMVASDSEGRSVCWESTLLDDELINGSLDASLSLLSEEEEDGPVKGALQFSSVLMEDYISLLTAMDGIFFSTSFKFNPCSAVFSSLYVLSFSSPCFTRKGLKEEHGRRGTPQPFFLLYRGYIYIPQLHFLSLCRRIFPAFSSSGGEGAGGLGM